MHDSGVPLRVEVRAPARLHLGFLDLHGGLGRRFGSLGLTIDGIATVLSLTPSDRLSIEGTDPQRARDTVERAALALGVSRDAHLRIEAAIPAHCGLGSGTQLGLAIGAGLARLHGRSTAPRAIAAAVERGARSGIGIGAFEQGGFLVDGGSGADRSPAPVIARLPFPEDWRILLVFDRGRHGLHGAAEADAFARLPPFMEAAAGGLCRLLVMQLLPGIVERDFAAVSAAIAEIQARMGDHFAPMQGGARYTSATVAGALGRLAAQGVVGLGQSSWGPTGFALIETEERANALLRDLERDSTDLTFQIVRARNAGAEIAAAPSRQGGSP